MKQFLQALFTVALLIFSNTSYAGPSYASFAFDDSMESLYFAVTCDINQAHLYQDSNGNSLVLGKLYQASDLPNSRFDFQGSSARVYLYGPTNRPDTSTFNCQAPNPAPVPTDGFCYQYFEMTVSPQFVGSDVVNNSALTNFGFPVSITSTANPGITSSFNGDLTQYDLAVLLSSTVEESNCTYPFAHDSYQCIYNSYPNCPNRDNDFCGLFGPNYYTNTIPELTTPFPSFKTYIASLAGNEPVQFEGNPSEPDAGTWDVIGTADGIIRISAAGTSSPYLEVSDMNPDLGASMMIYYGNLNCASTKLSGDLPASTFPASSKVIGDIAFAFAYGYMGSNTLVAADSTTGIYELSDASNPDAKPVSSLTGSQFQNVRPAFEEVQTTNAYYDPWAKVIHEKSNGTVYGHAYSDHWLATQSPVALNCPIGSTITISGKLPNLGPSLLGDMDQDGDVDTEDLNSLHDALGIRTTDVNNTGCINIEDLLLVIEDWGEGCTP